MIRRLLLPLSAALLAVTLSASACGGDDDDPETPEATQTTAGSSGNGQSSPTSAPARSPTIAASQPAGSDEEYIEAVCAAGAAFVKELAPAAGEYAKEVGESTDAAVIGPALQKFLAPPFEKFLASMQGAQPPADVREYHSQILTQLDRVTAKLQASDPTALAEITEAQLQNPPDNVAARLNEIAAGNADCELAGFFIGTPDP